MASSLYAGISGLNASTKQLDVIGNNIANVNTVGFRAGKIQFSDILSQSMTGGSSNAMQIGRGVSVSDITTQFSSGSVETTSNATDLSIDGEGFFMVNDSNGATYYTRAGAFHVDSEGNLVDVNGYTVQGYNLLGLNPNSIADLSLKDIQSNPEVTTSISIGANLDSQTASGNIFNAAQTIFDSLGQAHTLKMQFQKAEANGCWGVQAFLDNAKIPFMSHSGLKFNESGVLEEIYRGTASEVATNNESNGTISGLEVNNDSDIVDGLFTLTRGSSADSWTVASEVYGDISLIFATDEELAVSVTGGSTADITIALDGSWTTADTFDVTTAAGTPGTAVAGAISNHRTDGTASTAVINEGQIYQDGTLSLTRDTVSGNWTIAHSDYKNAVITSSGYEGIDDMIAVDLDGAGGADLMISLSGNWTEGDNVQVSLDNASSDASDIELRSIALSNGATIGVAESGTNKITWDLTGSTAEALTGYASTSVVKALTHDGYASGVLKSISVQADGVITGFFTNGQTASVGRIVLADFSNPSGLQRMGSNLFGETLASGVAIKNAPGTAGMGELTANSLELSNTDLATEFVNMITAQRAYQASAKVVTTTDQLMNELMNIKR
ncbi:MAG: flagellar basal-body rod protein FlgF [Syntrophales bacterium]|jgi:flagellar hook protein FlgE|nr:flagellar basal-body rod protein FlgF [Syntrophales bacterium]MDY0043106.1 flagellar basal-body rod protein FlgF [Syntrophales bacterium]